MVLQTPQGVHQGVEDPIRSAVVSWYSDSTDTELPAIAIDGDTTYGYNNIAPRLGNSIYKHVIIDSLLPGRTYDACIVDGPAVTLKTLLDVEDTLSFTVFGDQGIGYNAEPITRAASMAYDAQLHFVVGDLSYANGSRFPGDPPEMGEWWWETWDSWFNMNQKLAIQKPFICALGNHEYAEKGESQFEWEESASYRLHQPGNKKYFLLRIPPAAILVLDSSRLEGPKKVRPYSVKELHWVRQTLRELQNDLEIRWRIVMFHHPVYTASPTRRGNKIIKTFALPAMEEFGVDIIFTGHDHIYSRSHPILNDEPYIPEDKEDNYYWDPPGIIHVVTGGGGRGLGNSVDSPMIVKHQAIHHFMAVTIVHIKKHIKMQVRAIDKHGMEIDYFEIRKQ